MKAYVLAANQQLTLTAPPSVAALSSMAVSVARRTAASSTCLHDNGQQQYGWHAAAHHAGQACLSTMLQGEEGTHQACGVTALHDGAEQGVCFVTGVWQPLLGGGPHQ